MHDEIEFNLSTYKKQATFVERFLKKKKLNLQGKSFQVKRSLTCTKMFDQLLFYIFVGPLRILNKIFNLHARFNLVH